jgi:hypothetical protein
MFELEERKRKRGRINTDMENTLQAVLRVPQAPERAVKERR